MSGCYQVHEICLLCLQVTAVDVIELLVEVMDEDKSKHRRSKHSQSDERTDYRPLLEAKLAGKYQVGDYRELGVRIGAIGYTVTNAFWNTHGARTAVRWSLVRWSLAPQISIGMQLCMLMSYRCSGHMRHASTFTVLNIAHSLMAFLQ